MEHQHNVTPSDEIINIAISRASGSPSDSLYSEWLKQSPFSVKTVDLWAEENRNQALNLLEQCSGLLLTGGADVEPSRYGADDTRGVCKTNSDLDTHEFSLIQAALKRKIPILGICRGAQVLAVANGATLVQDIPTDTATKTIHASQSSVDAKHEVEIVSGSILAKITGIYDAEVNSLHHQAIDGALPEHVAVAARSADGIIEAIEWRTPAMKPGFMLGVQWHPQRLEYSHPLSGAIAEHFLFEAETFQILMQ